MDVYLRRSRQRARSGEVTCFVLADITLDNVVSDIWRFVLQYTVGMFLVIVLFGFLCCGISIKTVVRPINDITEASRNYAADKGRAFRIPTILQIWISAPAMKSKTSLLP